MHDILAARELLEDSPECPGFLVPLNHTPEKVQKLFKAFEVL